MSKTRRMIRSLVDILNSENIVDIELGKGIFDNLDYAVKERIIRLLVKDEKWDYTPYSRISADWGVHGFAKPIQGYNTIYRLQSNTFNKVITLSNEH